MVLIHSFAAIAMLAAGAGRPCHNASLGVETTNISASLHQTRHIPDYVSGALVRVVRLKSPAARVGIQVGDVIQGVGDRLLQNVCDLQRALDDHGCRSVHLTIRRGTETVTADVAPEDGGRFPPMKIDDSIACKDGDGAACRRLAQAHDGAADLLRLACDLGDSEGCFLVALKTTDPKKTFLAYEESCDGGNALACTNLGFQYEHGEGVAADADAAARFYERGCRGSFCTGPNKLGCVNLGRMYRGQGVDKDREATMMFIDVCNRKPLPHDAEDADAVAAACSLAGTAFLVGQGTAVDIPRSITYLEKGCDANYVLGCFNLATIYQRAIGVPRDVEKARKYYQRACDQGDKEACETGATLEK